ncbi:MAG TPA: CHAT domain-containing protein, partial [Gemmatimonadales bacterium]|nr:CHAT domain-containing protein [Gemmatimonadales bacterium]
HDSTDRPAVLGLATLARLTYDYPASDRLYPRLFVDSLHPDAYAAYARLGRAWSLEERGQSDAAGDEFARARRTARTAGDRAAEAEARIGQAFARGAVEGVAATKAILDSVGQIIPAGALDLQAERGWRRAMVRAILADSGATAEAVASVALARRSGELRVQAQAYRGLGRVLDWRGREDSALAAFDEAERRFRQARDRSWLAVTLMNRGNLLRNRGDLGEAMRAFRLTVSEGEGSHNLWAVASANTGLGVIAMQLDDFAAAAEHLNRAVAMFEAQGDRSSAVNAAKFLALIALAEGDVAEARRRTLESLAFYQGTGETLDQFGADQMLATIAMRERDWPAAERALAAARALLPKLEGSRWSASLAYDEGRLALARGNLAGAEHAFQGYLRSLDSTQHISRYDARLRLADTYAQRRELDAAEREALSAWDELERWRATLTDRELRLLAYQAASSENQVSPEAVSEQRASVARVLAALAAGGRVARAFELAERRRARELRDRMTRADVLRAWSAPSSEPVALGPAPFTSAADVAALMPDSGTAILEYVSGGLGAPTTLFVLSRGSPTLVRARLLPPADSLAGEVARFLALVQRGDELDSLARAFGAALLDPARAELGPGITRLIIVPDGPLHRVPWDLLRLPDGARVIERYAVSVAPSAAIVAALWRRPREPADAAQPARLLAFGDPVFAARRGASDPLDDMRSLPRLEASGREARLVSRYAPGATVRLRRDASATFLEHAPLDQYRVIHFATHAVVDDRSTARTALALAADSASDGLVGPGDLAALRLDADLVVLSGCRTAGGVVVEGEGVQGLTAPLLQAGARSVVASQWRIADRSTLSLIGDFYQALAEGLPVGDALRTAKLAALRRGVPAKEWAAFTTVGDPLVRVSLEVPRDAWRPAALVGATVLILGAGALIWVRRRRPLS